MRARPSPTFRPGPAHLGPVCSGLARAIPAFRGPAFPDKPGGPTPTGHAPARLRFLAVLLACGGLLGCQQPVATPPPPAPALPLPPSVPPAPLQTTEATAWRFATAADACTARAIGHDAELRIVLRRGHGVTFVLAAQQGPDAPLIEGIGALRFEGPAGAWSALAQLGSPATAATSLPLTDRAVGRVALMLGGGTLTPVGAGEALPILRLVPAGAAGSAWFACARGMLF